MWYNKFRQVKWETWRNNFLLCCQCIFYVFSTQKIKLKTMVRFQQTISTAKLFVMLFLKLTIPKIIYGGRCFFVMIHFFYTSFMKCISIHIHDRFSENPMALPCKGHNEIITRIKKFIHNVISPLLHTSCPPHQHQSVEVTLR